MSGKSGFFYTILPQSRVGKSVLVGSILTQAYSHQIPVVALDYPKIDSTSTFSDYIGCIQGQNFYFDITKQQHNLLEIPDLGTSPGRDV